MRYKYLEPYWVTFLISYQFSEYMGVTASLCSKNTHGLFCILIQNKHDVSCLEYGIEIFSLRLTTQFAVDFRWK